MCRLLIKHYQEMIDVFLKDLDVEVKKRLSKRSQ